MQLSKSLSIIAVLFLGALAFVTFSADMEPAEAAAPLAQFGRDIVFQGHIYVTGSTTPLVDVPVQLWTSLSNHGAWSYAATTKTNDMGYFEVRTEYRAEFDYEVRASNLPDYVSTGAVAPGGFRITADIVRYIYPPLGTYGGIIFYDRPNRPTATPTRTRTPTPTNTRGIIIKPTSTPTNTGAIIKLPTPTPTATKTPAPIDLYVTDLEVTQAIQDLDHHVPLIAGKRTYVRAHVRSVDGNIPGVLGEFVFIRGGNSSPAYKAANNPAGRITVREWPGRGLRDHSFFVEVPPSLIGSGNLRVIFRMNYDLAVPEPDVGNNWDFIDVSFSNSPPLRVKIFNVIYQAGGSWHSASIQDLLMMVSWLRRAYPVPSVDWHISSLYWPYADPPGAKSGDCSRVNSLLLAQWWADGLPNRRYYGMVTDTGSWMRGCSGVPSFAASGPTGTGGWGWNAWDTDGSYGDWYGAHELGHAYGRSHVACQGNEAGPDPNYPFPGGLIGLPLDPRTYYGWDIEQRRVYWPTWSDIMTYCSYEWISPYTYNAIRGTLLAEEFKQASRSAEVLREDALAVFGMANLTQGTAELHTLYHVDDWGVPEAPIPSEDWTLVLYDASGGALARYPFTPKADTEHEEGEQLMAGIQEVVSWEEGTVRVDVEYDGRQLASRAVSANAPTVRVVSPNGGELLDGPETSVRWEESDEDGDALVYAIQYSADAGATWQTIAVELSETAFTAPLAELAGSEAALFRVIASDGVNTGRDESDATFKVAGKAPMAVMLSPGDWASYGSGQQVVLAGEGYDVEDGVLDDQALSWTSDLDGPLGTGRHLAVADLQAGRHTITLTARDSDGQRASTTTTVFVDVPLSSVILPLILRT